MPHDPAWEPQESRFSRTSLEWTAQLQSSKARGAGSSCPHQRPANDLPFSRLFLPLMHTPGSSLLLSDFEKCVGFERLREGRAF